MVGEDRVTRDHVFTVRCWNEADGLDDVDAVWRMQVRHVNSGEERYFEKAGDLSRFIFKIIKARH